MEPSPPAWNVFDTAYSVLGLLIVLIAWALTDLGTIVPLAGFMVVAYAAGRAAGAHH
jgi:hypothetical protein